MKAHILKIAGAKNEKDFYSKFPTEASFRAKHGKELDDLLRMQNGGDTNKNGIPDAFENFQPNIQGPGPLPGPQARNYPSIGTTPTPQVNVPGNIGMIDKNGNNLPDYLEGQDAQVNQPVMGPENQKGNTLNNIGDMIPGIGSVVEGFKALKAEKQAYKGAQQWNQVSGVARKASETQDVNARTDIADTLRKQRQARIPTITGEELFPVYGAGRKGASSNLLTRHGGKMNYGGEIMNTFDPYDIYDDGGYEPLDESNQMKSYAYGGPMAAGGMSFGDILGAGKDSSFDWTGFGNASGSLAGAVQGNNAGAQIGGGVADAFSMIPGVGPIAGALAKPVFSTIGGMLDRYPGKTEAQQRQMMGNMAAMSGSNALRGFQNEFSGSFRHGGSLRTNSVGDIKTLSGGYLEPISYNPYTEGTGITSMIKGQSHDESNGRHSGVLMQYAAHGSSEPDVEAERGEPVSERNLNGDGTSAIIAGDQTFNKMGASLYPDLSKYQGQKVKNIQKKIAERDAKLNKARTKNTNALNKLELETTHDKLSLNSFNMNEKGIDSRYATNANEANNLLQYQEATNATAEEWGVDAGQLSRGKLKFNKTQTAAEGKELKPEDIEPPKGARGNIDPNMVFSQPGRMAGALDQTPIGISNPNAMFQSPEAYEKYRQETFKAYDDPEIAKQLVNYFLTYEGPDQADVRAKMSSQPTYKAMVAKARELATDYQPGRYHINTGAFQKPAPPAATPAQTTPTNPNYQTTPYRDNGWETIAGQIMPWMRKTPGEPLLGDQLAGEMYALSNNQVEPVQANFYRPQLDVPYDISLQDQLNENQADFNSMQRAVGNNPEALAALAAQKYMGNSRVLGEQFRLNQAKKDQVYSGNRATLNDAQLKNLSIADQQYARQAQAKSNTKLATQEALNSIASKIGQNRLENRTLQTYSNMFPQYSYNKNFSIQNTGAPASFYINQGIYSPDQEPYTHGPLYDRYGRVVNMGPIQQSATEKPKEETKKEEKTGRYGSLIKAFKNL
jgi:hypothetical protein